MTVATTNDYNMTALEIYEAAFNILGVAQEGEDMTARMVADAKRAANLMIKTWGAQENLWRMTEGTLPLVASQASYSLTNPRPMRIHSVRRKISGIETPLTPMSRQEYFDQPNKTTSPSIPVSFYFDPQQASGVLYLWPAPSTETVASYTINLTYLRRMADFDASGNELDMPQEWLETFIYNLAVRLMTQYPVNDAGIRNGIVGMAEMLYKQLNAFDAEPVSIFMQPDDLWQN